MYWDSPTSFASESLQAIANWSSAIPYLEWEQNTSTPEVVFKQGCPFGVYAKVTFPEATNWYQDENRFGAYWLTAEICLDPSAPWPSGQDGFDERVTALAHELGHVYGAHEQYHDQQLPYTCNGSYYGVMDTYRTDTGYIQSCDQVTTPQYLDTDLVNSFYRSGWLHNLAAVARPGNIGHYTWQDAAWAEYWHEIYVQKWNGSSWQTYKTYTQTAGVGGHILIPENTPQNFSFDWPSNGPGSHRACGRPWNISSGVYGVTLCTNEIWLN